MKVLLFSNDLMPFGELPTSGGGLRCWQLMKGLEAHGVEVIVSMPGFTYLAEKHFDKIPQAQRDLLWRWETQDLILKQTKPDAVLFASNWDHYGLSKPPEVPLIIDLHGSRLIETSMWNAPVSTDRKAQVFSKADCLLCAGTRQRSYFYGWLMQAGRVPANEHFIRYIPVSMSPNPPEHLYPGRDESDTPRFVSGGGWFPWQNQAKAIFAICREVSQRNRGTIEIYGTPHENQNLSAEERAIREIYAQVKRLGEESPRISAQGYVGREALIEVYRRASVAVEVMRYNIERELAFTTRTVEYLWCGLPVLYNDYAELSEHIREYDAGWTVDPDDDSQIQAALEEIFSDPDAVIRKGQNAARLVQDRFRWDQTILPLIDFLNHPVKMPVVEPALGPVCVRASFLSPTGTSVDVPLAANGESLEQQFVIPAENICTVELPFALAAPEKRANVKYVELTLKKVSGSIVRRKRIPQASLPNSGKISIDFPLWARPVGGKQYVLAVKAVTVQSGAFEESSNNGLFVRGLLEGSYPLNSRKEPLNGRTLLGQDIPVQALALSFIPAGGRLYRLKAIFQRAVWMMRNGEWSRLGRAGLRRMPAVVHRLRHAMS